MSKRSPYGEALATIDHTTMFEVATHGGVAFVTAGIAVLLLVANARRPWNHWLAFFLLLVAGNFAFDGASKALAILDGANPPSASTQQLVDRLESLAFLCVAFDPAVLVYFASIFPRRGGMATRPWGVALLALPVLTFTALEVNGRLFTQPALAGPLWTAFTIYLAACYAYASIRIVRSYLEEGGDVMADQLRVVAFGFLVAMVPRIGLAAVDLRLPPGELLWTVDFAVRMVVLGAAAALLLRAVRRAPGGEHRRRHARGLFRATVAVYVLFVGMWTVEILIRFTPEAVAGSFYPLASYLRGGLTFSIRWFVFAAAIAYGVVRYQLLAVGGPTWRAGAVATAGVGLGAATLGTGLLAGPLAAGVAAGAGAALCLAAAALLGSRRDQPEYLHERGLEVYRALLAAHLASGSAGPGTAAELERARKRLGIADDEHDALEAIAEVEEASRGDGTPQHFGRYRVLRRLGAGGSASVYLARDARREGLVVLKRVHAGSNGAVDAALREMTVARRVSHPHVLALHDHQRLADGALIVAEYAEGGSLRDLLKARGPLPPAEAARILGQALLGLGALHEAGVVHGDVKPENLLLDRSGSVKVADFGLARLAAHGRLTHATVGLGGGTPAYMPPEVARGQRPTFRSDLWSVAAVGFELLTGAEWRAARDPWTVLRKRLGPEAAGWEPWLRAGLADDPAVRPAHAAAMMARLPTAREARPERGATRRTRFP